MIVGFTCGSFDLLHAGHVLMLQEVRGQVDMLLVGLHSDPTLDRPEKNKPVQTVEERRIQLLGCRYVDSIFDYHTERDLLTALQALQAALYASGDRLIRFLGADWQGKQYTGCDLGIETRFNSRDHGYSSSELRRRITLAEAKAVVYT